MENTELFELKKQLVDLQKQSTKLQNHINNIERREQEEELLKYRDQNEGWLNIIGNSLSSFFSEKRNHERLEYQYEKDIEMAKVLKEQSRLLTNIKHMRDMNKTDEMTARLNEIYLKELVKNNKINGNKLIGKIENKMKRYDDGSLKVHHMGLPQHIKDKYLDMIYDSSYSEDDRKARAEKIIMNYFSKN